MFSKTAATAAVPAAVTVRRLSAAAVLGLTLVATAACGSTSPTAATNPSAGTGRDGTGTGAGVGASSATPTAAAVNAANAAAVNSAPLTYTAGMTLISNGTATVMMGARTVTFPTTVTDAAWSPDGSRIAFVDAQGNIAAAHPDGTGLVTLTKTDSTATRSQPTWDEGVVVYAQKDAKGLGTLEAVALPAAPGAAPSAQPVFTGNDAQSNPVTDNFAPSAQSVAPTTSHGIFDMAYEHEASDGPDVWVIDSNQRENDGWKVVDGTDPAVSPDGSQVAFVDRQGQVEVVSAGGPASPAASGQPVRLTLGATSPSHLVWSPDGSHLSYSTSGGAYSVAAKPSSHSANSATQLSATHGAVVTYLDARSADQVGQFGGTDPVALSVAASADRWPAQSQYEEGQTSPASEAAIGSVTDLSSDASLLPSNLDGPLLLTGGQSLDPKVAAELRRVFDAVSPGPGPGPGRTPTVYLLGSTTQISATVAQSLTQMGYQVQRVTSPGQTGGAAPGAPVYSINRLRSFVAVDQNNPLDNLLGTAFAAGYGAPVVQVGAGTTLPTSVAGWIAQTTGSTAPAVVFVPASNITPLPAAIAGAHRRLLSGLYSLERHFGRPEA